MRLVKVFIFLMVFVIGVDFSARADPAVRPLVAQTDNSTITGVWTGQCGDCVATRFTLKFVQTGSGLTGTIQIDGTNSFGGSEKPLTFVERDGNTVFFEVEGDSGTLFEVELKVSADGKNLIGDGKYGDGFFDLKFKR